MRSRLSDQGSALRNSWISWSRAISPTSSSRSIRSSASHAASSRMCSRPISVRPLEDLEQLPRRGFAKCGDHTLSHVLQPIPIGARYEVGAGTSSASSARTRASISSRIPRTSSTDLPDGSINSQSR